MDSVGGADLPMMRLRQGFTLLEIVIALAILSVSLMVLVESQMMSVVQTMDSQRILTANSLAEAKLAEVLLELEMKGFSDTTQGEEGSFETFGDEGEYGEVIDFEGEYDDYGFAWTIRPVKMELGDIAGTLEELEQSGMTGSQDEGQKEVAEENGVSASALSSFMSPEALDEMLSPWLREVRVVVWWGTDPGDLKEGEECDTCVELVSHTFNPSGTIVASGEEG